MSGDTGHERSPCGWQWIEATTQEQAQAQSCYQALAVPGRPPELSATTRRLATQPGGRSPVADYLDRVALDRANADKIAALRRQLAAMTQRAEAAEALVASMIPKSPAAGLAPLPARAMRLDGQDIGVRVK